MQNRLFAVYLGGRAAKGNTELHDVVFATGPTIEDTYEQLLDKWFGMPKGLHLDSWMELDIVDGYKISLSQEKSTGGKKLFFVNLGAYKDNEFAEIHANIFLVADAAPEAKRRAKAELLKNWPSAVHTDDLYEVDSCIELGKVNSFHIALMPTEEKQTLRPNNGYHIIPKGVIADYIERHDIAPSLHRKGWV